MLFQRCCSNCWISNNRYKDKGGGVRLVGVEFKLGGDISCLSIGGAYDTLGITLPGSYRRWSGMWLYVTFCMLRIGLEVMWVSLCAVS